MRPSHTRLPTGSEAARTAPLAWLTAALAPLLATLSLSAQSDVIARYTEGSATRTVSRDDVAEELCRRFQDTERGHGALAYLIDLELIRSAAGDQGLMPGRDATLRYVARLERELLAAGVDLAQLRASKGMSTVEFDEYAQLQLAHERLVRASLELDDDEPVRESMLQLWLQEARQRHERQAPARLPPGVIARVGDRSVSRLDLGRVLLQTMDQADRERYVRQVVLQRRIQALAEQHAVTVSDGELTAEVEARRRRTENDARYRGAKFDDLLRAQGMDAEMLRRSPVLHAQVLEEKLIGKLHPDAELDRRIDEEPAAIERSYGARRRLQVIAIRTDAAMLDAAIAKAEGVRDQIAEGLPFADAARRYSDDAYSKMSNGDVGWHYLGGKELPQVVLTAAFEAGVGEVLGPLSTDRGVYLARVVAVEDPPNRATMKFRMRRAFARELRDQLLREAAIQLVAANAPPPAGGPR
ncbi:MAG: peptidylprolyl isomerase [Planctomycetota bacterium]